MHVPAEAPVTLTAYVRGAEVADGVSLGAAETTAEIALAPGGSIHVVATQAGPGPATGSGRLGDPKPARFPSRVGLVSLRLPPLTLPPAARPVNGKLSIAQYFADELRRGGSLVLR